MGCGGGNLGLHSSTRCLARISHFEIFKLKFNRIRGIVRRLADSSPATASSQRSFFLATRLTESKGALAPPGKERFTMISTVIIVPSQGHDTNSFFAVATDLRAKVYPHAKIVKTTVTKTTTASGGVGGAVTLTDGKSPFTFDAVPNLTRVLTISHSFSGAGQNLTYGDDSFGDDGSSQPWGTTANDGNLSDEGKSFWTSVGDSMQLDGKIIMLGCFMGAGNYAASVAKATQESVFASTALFAAGNSESALKYVKAIEKDVVLKPMKRFDP
jgi:hypothetical protein